MHFKIFEDIFVLAAILFVFQSPVNAQTFWQTTAEYPDGPKTGIVLADDSCLIVSTSNGIIRSCDLGMHFEKILSSSGCTTVFVGRTGRILAGGRGRIFYSDDTGVQWDSILLPFHFDITQIVEDPFGNLFAITGQLEIPDGFVGAGVYFSDDYGKSWNSRNLGLPANQGCERISVDQDGIIYLGVPDQDAVGIGGLFISENRGESWKKSNVIIDGRGEINNQIRISSISGISISPEDSIYLSCTGVAVNSLVELNLVRKIDSTDYESQWKVFTISDNVSWFLDKALNNMFFATDGTIFSSFTGNLNLGGTFYLKEEDTKWIFETGGLSLGIDGYRNQQHFVETREGGIFMIQYNDENIYFRPGTTTSDDNFHLPISELLVYPNPLESGGQLTLFLKEFEGENVFSLVDATGKELYRQIFIGAKEVVIPAPNVPGFYFLRINSRSAFYLGSIVVY